MNKLIAPLLSIALLAGCANEADDAAVAERATATPVATEATAAPAVEPAAAATGGTAASATGTVESVDAEGGRIVITHGPVEALGWPGMTMGFKATPGQIQAVQPGRRVAFDFTSQGANNTITRIEPVQ